VIESPTIEEDASGEPFSGAAGRMLVRVLESVKAPNAYVCHVVKCVPPGGREPEPDEINACAPHLEQQLIAANPLVILTMGATALHRLVEMRAGMWSTRGVWREWRGIPLLPTLHPAYLLRNPKDKGLVWKDVREWVRVWEERRGRIVSNQRR
jgi:DNA polymerase